MKNPSIRLLVGAAVMTPAVVIAGLLVWVGNATANRLANDLGNRLLTSSAERIGTQVENYLGEAMRTGDRFTRQVETGSLGATDLDAWRRPVVDLLATNPRLAAVTYGTPGDDAFYVQRMPNGYEFCNARRTGGTQERTASDGTSLGPANPHFSYRPSQRPWFVEATTLPQPRWTAAYTWFSGDHTQATMSSAYVRQARAGDGHLLGVVCVDVTLDDLSKYLRTLRPAESSALYIVDRDGVLIASSRGPVTREGSKRVAMRDSDDPVTATLGRALSTAKAAAGAAVRVDVGEGVMRTRLTRLTPYTGVDWQVVAAIPEGDLLADARETRRRSVLIALLVSVLGAVFAWAIARRIVQPILDVQRHVNHIAGGDFETRLAVGGARELVELSHDINAMTADLRNRMELMQSMRLATQVQQSLLPQAPPTSARFDVCGRSIYCDQTGGDYFDFIEVHGGGDGAGATLLVAVGDVSGHGIGSAMMMACARGALRAVLLDENADLAAALNRTNQILMQAESGLFMTMTLMRIAAATATGGTGVATWASAGHDAAIVFDPKLATFRELDGAEVPLGFIAAEYQTYRSDGLEPGMVLIIGTDGIWEMFNPAGEQYGKERMKEVIAANADRSSKAIGAALEVSLAAFRLDERVHDDVTYVIVKVC